MSKECKEWERICDKCKGSGRIEITDHSTFFSSDCTKCHGTGKIDWIEEVVGKRKTYHEDFLEVIANTMAQEIADKIDKEIIESFAIPEELLGKDKK